MPTRCGWTWQTAGAWVFLWPTSLRLLRATPAQRNNYTISGGGTGLHWEDLDEDILVSALLLGIKDRTRSTHHEVLVARDRKADE